MRVTIFVHNSQSDRGVGKAYPPGGIILKNTLQNGQALCEMCIGFCSTSQRGMMR